jgi:PAS domain S-box-containing protein
MCGAASVRLVKAGSCLLGEGEFLALEVPAQDGLGAVREARRSVVSELVSRGLGALAEDAGLAVGELVANAVLHGEAPIRVRLHRRGAGVRLSVADASSVMPEALDAGPEQTVGRGIMIVEAVSARWGWQPRADGKIVWCDLPVGLTDENLDSEALDEAVAPHGEPSLRHLGSPHLGSPQVWSVRVPDVPVSALRDYVLRVDEQVRELRLATDPGDRSGLPALGQQIREWTGQPGDGALLRTQALAAARAGRDRVDVLMVLPLVAAAGAARHLAALDAVDAYCRAGWLLAAASTLNERCFRQWLLSELAEGVQRAAGIAAPPPRRFEAALVEEVERFSVDLAGRENVDRVQPAAGAASMKWQATTGSGCDQVGSWGQAEPTDATFEQLLDAAPDAMVAVDQAGMIRLVNRQTEQLFGYGRHELVDRPLELLIPEPFRGAHPGHRARYVADPRTRPMGAGLELSGRRRDGSQFPADIALSWIETVHGPLAIAAVRDITASRAAREALRESRQIAEVLQRSLLEVVPARVSGLPVAVRYHPAISSALVGGDWHHVFTLESGAVGISVGDVVGKGIKAAATMGRVRTALATIAADEPSPGVVLGKVNRMLCRLAATLEHDPHLHPDSDLLATSLYGRIDHTTHEFVYAVAGHPGPIIIDTGLGAARIEEPTPNLPLGVESDTIYQEERLQLPTAGALIVFTDGLFERRDTPLQESLDTLVQHATTLTGRSVEQIADALLEAATHTPPEWADDIALIVIGWHDDA